MTSRCRNKLGGITTPVAMLRMLKYPRIARLLFLRGTFTRGNYKHFTTHMGQDGNFISTLPANIAAPEYGDPDRTPLKVDTAKLPFEIFVKKPKR
jgi:hypothetical protein